ncbi:MAG: hypothetical protein WBA93_11765 [Microcoleaceae cyanobacterium]
MRQKVLLDTGPLVAFINNQEYLHPWAIDELTNIEPPLLTCEAVITQACSLLRDVYGAEDAVIGLLSSGNIEISFSLSRHRREK